MKNVQVDLNKKSLVSNHDVQNVPYYSNHV